MTGEELAAYEEGRDLGQEGLEGLHDIKAGKSSRRFTVRSYHIVRIQGKVGLSQVKFARLLGVSMRTLQDWEQGRRQPSGAAKTLIKVAERHPEVLHDVAA